MIVGRPTNQIAESGALAPIIQSAAEREILSENTIPHLLKLAGISPSDKKAAASLRETIEGAQSSYRAAKQRPLAADHNSLLTDIEKSAKELTKRIERLRRHPFTRYVFWHSKAFGPVYRDRVEVHEVLSSLESIVLAADMAKDRRQGRRRETGKQHVVDAAFGFFVRFSALRPGGSRTGAFRNFARQFYSAAIGDPDNDRGLDRQIRQALTRLSIERQRARRKSGEKPRDSS